MTLRIHLTCNPSRNLSVPSDRPAHIHPAPRYILKLGNPLVDVVIQLCVGVWAVGIHRLAISKGIHEHLFACITDSRY